MIYNVELKRLIVYFSRKLAWVEHQLGKFVDLIQQQR
jgi:hypothetical protein